MNRLRYENCAECEGRSLVSCEECGGGGEVELIGNTSSVATDPGYYNVRCEDCKGDGEVSCGWCGGAGRIPSQDYLEAVTEGDR